MLRIPARQAEFVYSGDVYDALIPPDHYLRKVDDAVDFSFANEVCRDLYSPDNGRPTTNYPDRMLRAEFAQYHYDLSDREMEEAARYNLAIRWFLGYGAHDLPFEFTALCEFRARLGADRHKQLFDGVLAQLKAAGLVDEKEPQNVDATHVPAKVAALSTPGLIHRAAVGLLRMVRKISPEGAVAVEKRAAVSPEEEEAPRDPKETDSAGRKAALSRSVGLARRSVTATKEWVAGAGGDLAPEGRDRIQGAVELLERILDENVEEVATAPSGTPEVREREERPGDRIASPVDPDARHGRKSKTKKFTGYKVHLSVTDRAVVTRVEVTAGNRDDGNQLPGMAEGMKKDHGIEPPKTRADSAYGTGANYRMMEAQGCQLAAPLKGRGSPTKGFGKERFRVDESRGVVECPGGQESVGVERRPGEHGTVYFFSETACGSCPLKVECTTAARRSIFVSEFEAEFERARAYQATEEGKEDRGKRAVVERVNGEMKGEHGLGRARMWGLAKMAIQGYLTSIVVNVKRLVGWRERKEVVAA